MKNSILPVFIFIVIPTIYHLLDESVTLTITAIFAIIASVFAIWKHFSNKIISTKLFNIVLFLLICWLFTICRSLPVSCSLYASFPTFIKVCILLLISFSVNQQFVLFEKSYNTFYRIATLSGLLFGLLTILEYIEAPPIPDTWLDPSSKELFRTRCCGIMTDPNIFAAFLSVLFIMTVALILSSKFKKEQIFSGVSLVICGTGIFMTLSRGGWIALFLSLTAFAISLFIGKQKLNSFNLKVLSISILLLSIIFFSGPFKYRLFSITKPTDMTFFQRTLINKGIFKSVNKIPIYGHGLHTFNQVYPLYRIVGGDYPLYAHNEFLQSLIETGWLSSILLLYITLLLLRIFYKSAKKKDFNTLVFSTVFISLLIQNLSGFSSRILPTSVLLAFSVGGILASQLNIIPKGQTSSNKDNAMKLLDYSIILLIMVTTPCIIFIYTTQNQLNMANKLSSNGKVTEATVIYEKLLNIQPDNSIAANNLGQIKLIQHKYEEAAHIWENAFKYNRYEATFPANLARLYSKTNVEISDLYYKKALELDPASENYRVEYAKFLIAQNRKLEAKQILLKGLTYSPGFHNVYKGFKQMENLISTL